MVNHYEEHAEITTKNLLFKNVRKWHDERKELVFKEMLPITFCLKLNIFDGVVDTTSLKSQMKLFKEVFKLLK